MKLPIAEWMYRWLNENPMATIEEGLREFELAEEYTIVDLVNKYPNDAELGENVRKYFNKKK